MIAYRRFFARSPHPVAVTARAVRRSLGKIYVPAPAALVRPILALYLFLREIVHYLLRLVVIEPMFKAYCYSYGSNLHTGIYLPWVVGRGRIVIGDDVRIWGKLDLAFAASFADAPTLKIGDGTSIGHNVSISIGKSVSIGNNCFLAGGVRIFDSSGHPVDPERRLAGYGPDEEDVQPVTIGSNVWFGANSVVFPGVTVGSGSVISSNSVVTSDVPPNSLVAGYPARRIRDLTKAVTKI